MNYQDALKYDYPSVGQIAQALRTQDIIPIFAAQQGVREFYDVSHTSKVDIQLALFFVF